MVHHGATPHLEFSKTHGSPSSAAVDFFGFCGFRAPTGTGGAGTSVTRAPVSDPSSLLLERLPSEHVSMGLQECNGSELGSTLCEEDEEGNILRWITSIRQ